jgi:hypothetical protein
MLNPPDQTFSVWRLLFRIGFLILLLSKANLCSWRSIFDNVICLGLYSYLRKQILAICEFLDFRIKLLRFIFYFAIAYHHIAASTKLTIIRQLIPYFDVFSSLVSIENCSCNIVLSFHIKHLLILRRSLEKLLNWLSNVISISLLFYNLFFLVAIRSFWVSFLC